jgi:N-acetylmuramoyl-L-alanine amidase
MSRTSLKHRWRPSPNIGPRRGVIAPELVILHYTGMKTAQAACDWLCSPQSGVSCHYLIDEAGAITQMVDEDLRAWHAGVASWKGQMDINSRSVGIEIHNLGHDFGYTDFPAPQIEAVIELCRDITVRQGIARDGILAHSDVAPSRKIDPGEKFPWRQLYEAGIGHWVPSEPVTDGAALKNGDSGPEVDELRSQLALYGYGIETAGGFDRSMEAVVRAFQRHFRQERVDGIADLSTIHTLQRLLAALPASI